MCATDRDICEQCGGDASESNRDRYNRIGICDKCYNKENNSSKITVHQRHPKYNNYLVQMVLMVNGHYYNFNNYMTNKQMTDASEKLKSIECTYDLFRVVSQDIGISRYNFNEQMKTENKHVYHSFNKMFIHMSWQHKFK